MTHQVYISIPVAFSPSVSPSSTLSVCTLMTGSMLTCQKLAPVSGPMTLLVCLTV